MNRLAVAAVTLTAALTLAPACLPARAAEVALPQLWDAKERLPNPSMAQLPRLRFLTTTDFPPFNFMDSGGRLTGFHVDLARAICAKLNVADRCEIQALPWDELQPALARGDGEAILAGLAVNAANRETLAFSRPYLMFPARFVVRKAEPLVGSVYGRVQGQRIGVLAGSAHERMLRAEFGEVKPVTYDRPEWMYEDLKAGKISGLFGDGMRLSLWLGSQDAADCCIFAGGPYLSSDYLGQGLAVALKPADQELTQAIDHALQTISVEGALAELYLRYFPIGFY